MTERRTRRSRDRAESLALFLESQRSKLHVDGLAVTTRGGRLLAGVGPSPDRLARAALELHHAHEVEEITPKGIATWWLRAGGTEVLIASAGGRLSHELGTGVRRILTT